jgi:hypothetical protein
VLDLLEETVGEVEEIVKKQMRDEKGWEWDVVYGFHAVPSMKSGHLYADRSGVELHLTDEHSLPLVA